MLQETGAAGRIFDLDSPQAAPLLRFQPIQSITFPVENAQEAERTAGVHFLGKETPGDMTLEESAENLRGKEMLLSGAQGLSERSELTGAPLCT